MIEFKKIELSDCLFVNELRNNCAEEFLHNSSKYTILDTIRWYSTLTIPYYIVYVYENRIGYFRLSDYSKTNHTIYIGMDIDKRFRGKGYGYQSYKKFIPYILKEYNLHKISLEVLSTNIVAYNLYKKLGFVVEGIKRQEVLKKNKYVDSIIMSLLKDEILNSPIYKNENN